MGDLGHKSRADHIRGWLGGTHVTTYCVTVGKMSVRYKPSHLSLDSHSNYGQRMVIYTHR